jgi:hypothetical protein
VLIAAAVGLLGAPAGQTPVRAADPERFSAAEFDALHKQLDLKNQPWATIPWKVSVTEARRLAAKEQKPIFLVVNTGNCLGFV